MPKDLATHEQRPEPEYHRRLELLRAQEAHLKHRDSILGYVNLANLLLGVVATVWILTSRIEFIYWVFLPASLFIFFAVMHERVVQAMSRCSRGIAFYELGLARIGNTWAGKGVKGERFSDPSHPYSRDLDLFGSGSLFELLCTARTRAGEETLANWLLAPAPPAEVLLRQTGVIDFRGRLELREDLAALGEQVRSAVRPEDLAEWGEKTPEFDGGPWRIVLPFLTSLWLVGAGAWLFWHFKALFLLTSLVNVSVAYAFRVRLKRSVAAIERAAHDLKLLSNVLARLEREEFSTPKLITLQSSLQQNGLVASYCIARLNRLVDSLVSRRGLLVQTLDAFVLWSLQFSFAIEAWRKRLGPFVRPWLAAVGELEALSALAGYAYEHPKDAFPEFTEDGSLL
jgi:hypothetical protein